MRPVQVSGTGMTPFGRHLGRTHKGLTQQAVMEALSDAGATVADVDTAFYATVSQGFLANEQVVPGQFALRELGLEGVPVLNVENACASSSSAFWLGYSHIRAGLADCVLVVGTEKLYSEDRDARFAVFNQPPDIAQAKRFMNAHRNRLAPAPSDSRPDGPRSILMDSYAGMCRLHMATYGTTQEQLAYAASKNHAHSVHNPLSQYRSAISVEEVLAAPTVAWPLTVPMCAPISDGSAAAVLCSEEMARRLGDRGGSSAVEIRSCIMRTGSNRDGQAYDRQVARLAALDAYEQAGIGPEDVSVVELHDASALGDIVQAEALGFCPLGDGGAFVASGATSLGGALPTNTSGGLVSKGHPLAATGLGQIHELVTQLRGRAGTRQVPDPRVALAENGGGFIGVEEAAVVITILTNR